jgi:signal transduction histidine kinase
MAYVKRTLADAVTYRKLAYLLSGVPLGLVWFVALVTVWSVSLGFLITPLVIPLMIGLAFMTRGFAAIEAEIARSLLGVDAHAPAVPSRGRGFWAWLRGMFGASFWRAQAYLLIRWLAGFPVGLAIFCAVATALGMICAPAWVPFVRGGAQFGFWRPHTFVQALALVPAGLILLAASLMLVSPLAAMFRPAASGLLRADGAVAAGTDTARTARTNDVSRRRALEVHAAVDGVVIFVLVLIWALTSLGYFWPVWVALPLAAALSIHWWLVWIGGHPLMVQHYFRDSRTLAGASGIGAAVSVYLISVWAITGHGYFWPIWPILGIAAVLGALTAAALLSAPRHAEMAERIETLESTRAGAVDLQDSELRRIERDLHDGAQARLVALGMSLGMAEQKLAQDPEHAGELIAEARAGAEVALRELRDLARGIHPPVLADRGLGAALASLASSTPMRVDLSVALTKRPAPAVESAVYFVAAEALANAAKHSHADRVDIRITSAGDVLELQVEDDGDGGAKLDGTGLLGMRRRVEALDGRLSVTSPRGGPTTIRAELPCAS